MEKLPRCDKCNDCIFDKSKKHDGYTHYCKTTGRDVGQSHFGKNSPKNCPKRTGGVENGKDSKSNS